MKEKILIVEDTPLHMKLMEITIRAQNYTLLKATDGEEALDIAARERPDLILMDIRLPKMSGFEVAKKLRENPALSHIPIIAITAHAMSGDRDKIIASGCATYLTKPVDTRQLPGVIAEMLLKRKKETPSVNVGSNGKENPDN